MKKFLFLIALILLSTFLVNAQTWDFYDLNVAASNYDMVSDNNGDIHILWKSGVYQLSHGKVTYNAGSGSYEVTGITSFNTTYAIHVRFTRPRLAVRGDGSEIHTTFISTGITERLTHVWKDSAGWHETVFWSYPNSGTGWYTAFPAIGVDLSGNVHIVASLWKDGYGQWDKIIYWRKPSGGSWSSSMIIQSDVGAEWRDVSAYTDKNGGFHATWKTGPKPYGIYKYAANGASLASSPAIQIPNLGGANGYFDMVSFGETFVAPNGDVHHAYTHYPESALSIQHTIKPNGSNTFSYPTEAADIDNCESCGNYLYENPWCTLAVLPNGVPIIGWAENRESGDVNYINLSILEGSSWVHYEVDNLAKIDRESRPVIALNDTDTYMVWRRNTGYLRLAVMASSNPTIAVTSPVGNESWTLGSVHNITWTASDLTNDVKITLWKDDALVGLIVKDLDPDLGTYTWTTGTHTAGTAVTGIGYKIKIREQGGAAFTTEGNSVNGFGISQATLTSPNGGESWQISSSQDITWNTSGFINTLKITLWKDDVIVGLIAKDISPASGSYSWTAGNHTLGTAVSGSGYKIKIREQGGAAYLTEDGSDTSFTLTPAPPPSITVTSPNGGESWQFGTNQNITWTASGMTNDVKITLWKGGTLVGVVKKDINPASGSYTWITGVYIGGTAAAGTDYTVKIREQGGVAFTTEDSSNANFSITASTITVTRPNGGETERAGTMQTVTWTSTGTIANVKIESSPDSGQSWFTLTDSIPNTGSYSDVLPVETPPLSTYLLRISNAATGYPTDDSNGTFTVLPALPISVISPNGGEDLIPGNSHNITWTSIGLTNDVKITLWKDDVLVGLIVKDIDPALGTYSWTIGSTSAGTAPDGTGYKIKIREQGGVLFTNEDQSDASFTLSD